MAKSITLSIADEDIPACYRAIGALSTNTGEGILIPSASILVCHYDKKLNTFSYPVSNLPSYVSVVCCYPNQARRLNAINVLGDWENETIIRLDVRAKTLTIRAK